MIKPLKVITIDNESENIDLNLTMHPNHIIFYVKDSKINNINLKISKNQHILIISTNSEFNMSMNNNIGKNCPTCPSYPKKNVLLVLNKKNVLLVLNKKNVLLVLNRKSVLFVLNRKSVLLVLNRKNVLIHQK